MVLPQTNEFTPIFTRDISKDLNIEPTQQPHFLMVSGRYRLQPNTDMPRGAQSLLYVAELNTGRMISYACGKINNGPAYIKPLASIPVPRSKQDPPRRSGATGRGRRTR